MAFVGLRLPDELKAQLEEDARRSGWSISEQIRFELLERRGQWEYHKPYLPNGLASGRPVRRRRADAS